MSLNPAENVRRRKAAAEHAPWLEAELRRRLPDLPLEIEVEAAIQPVGDEVAHLFIRTDGLALLRVQGVANDLTRELASERDVVVAARVWPRTIWCRRSTVPRAPARAGRGQPRTDGLVYSERDARGNTRLCLIGSHAGDHDFGE